MATGDGSFLFLIPSKTFSFMLPFNAGVVTFFVSIMLASTTSFLLTVVRHLICIYGATVSRGGGISSTDFLPREDGIIPFFQDIRFMWRFGGIRRRPHIIVSIIGIIMLYIDAYAISGVVANADCSFGKFAVVEKGVTPNGICLDADPAGNGDAQIGRAAVILQTQRKLGFPIKGIPGRVSTDSELQVYYPESCGGEECPEAETQTVAGCTASPWKSAEVEVLFVSVNLTLNEFRMGYDDTYVPNGYPVKPQYWNEFTRVLGSPVAKSFDSSGRAQTAPFFTITQTLYNGDDRSAAFLGGYLDLRHNGFVSGDKFSMDEGSSRVFRGPLWYRVFTCERVGERPVIWVTSAMLRDATQLRLKREGDEGEPCWKERREARCAPSLDEVYTAGLASLLGVGSPCDVPLVRARTCTGIRPQTIGILGASVSLAFFLALAGLPFYIKARKRTGYWHHSVDKFVEVVCKTIDGRDYEPGFSKQRRAVWVRAPMAKDVSTNVWTLSTESSMNEETSLSQRAPPPGFGL